MPLNPPPSDHPSTLPGGTLYLVATPIGNLEDITLRALRVLGSVDLIAAEDTRHTGQLLSHFNISTPLISFHEHNETGRSVQLIEKMKNGASIALVSDAGTPLVSDPGYKLISLAVEKGVQIVPIPGVSAAITALIASGLPTDTFVFIGFTARKKNRQREQIAELKNDKRTLIFYESPRRVIPLLETLREILGERDVVLARELTKVYEEFVRGRLSVVIESLSQRSQVKGECTLVVSGTEPAPPDMALVREEIRKRLEDDNVSPSFLSRELSEKYSFRKRIVYEEILRIKSEISEHDGEP